MTEHTMQVALFQWAELRLSPYPELALMFAIPNGAKLPYVRNKYGRYSPEAIRLKDEGLRPGVPDVFLPCARDPYHGLFIEMKYGKNKTSEKQNAFIAGLRAHGYKCVVCWTWEEAAQEIEEYLGG